MKQGKKFILFFFSIQKIVLFKKINRVNVPDERFDWLCEFHKPASKVPPVLQVIFIYLFFLSLLFL